MNMTILSIMLALGGAFVQTPRTQQGIVRGAGVELHADDEMGIRMRRPLSLMLEAGYNGLVGAGALVGYQLSPHWAVDAGVGAAHSFVKVGARVRYNLLTGRFTPFASLGFSVGSGSFGKIIEENDDDLPARYSIGVSPYGQAMAGISLQDKDGLFVMAGGGWSQLLRDANFFWQAAPLPRQRKTLPGSVGSGFVASIAVGMAL